MIKQSEASLGIFIDHFWERQLQPIPDGSFLRQNTFLVIRLRYTTEPVFIQAAGDRVADQLRILDATQPSIQRRGWSDRSL